MRQFSLVCTCLLALITASAWAGDQVSPPVGVTERFSDADWPWWRGVHRDGMAEAGQKAPAEFGTDKNVIWRSPIPGRGHGSAIVVRDKIFLATADEKEQVQSLVCLDRNGGKQLWKADLHRGNFVGGGNKKSSHASATPACDGDRVFITFINSNAVNTSAVSIDGKKLWQRKICDYVLHQGYGASPTVAGRLVIVMGDNKGGGAVAGLDRISGEIKWSQPRPKKPNYSSPILLSIGGREQIIQIGCDMVSSYDPITGQVNWEAPGATTECVTSAVTDGERIFTSGGYPKNHVAAMKADGSGKIDWEVRSRVYVPSMLVKDGTLYCVTDAGVAMARECATGKELWSQRLNGTFSASPVMVGNRVYAINETGEAFVFDATPAAFTKLAENRLGDEAFATPTICGGRIYLRVAHHEGGNRQEYLYCVGEK